MVRQEASTRHSGVFGFKLRRSGSGQSLDQLCIFTSHHYDSGRHHLKFSTKSWTPASSM